MKIVFFFLHLTSSDVHQLAISSSAVAACAESLERPISASFFTTKDSGTLSPSHHGWLAPRLSSPDAAAAGAAAAPFFFFGTRPPAG